LPHVFGGVKMGGGLGGGRPRAWEQSSERLNAAVDELLPILG